MTPLRPCLECGRPCHGARCPTHARRRRYSSAHWQHVRKQRLTLDHHTCTLAYPGCTRHATTVHLDPACDGDHALATINNTRSACARCHGLEDGPRASGYDATSARVGGGLPIEEYQKSPRDPASGFGSRTPYNFRDIRIEGS